MRGDNMMGIDEDFLNAAKSGDCDQLEELVRQDADVNYQDYANEYCALTYAVENDDYECVCKLLSFDGIKTDLSCAESKDCIGGIPLHIAAFRGYRDIIQLLIEKSPQDLDEFEYCGYTPLHETVLSGELDAFQLLLDLGADDEAQTGPDEGVIGVPEGLNTEELIFHQLEHCGDHRTVLKAMLRYLNKYDSDSEDDSDYCYDEMDVSNFDATCFSKTNNSQYILHARGMHFYTNQFNSKQKSNYKSYSQSGLLNSAGMYSADTHKRAKLDFSLPEFTGIYVGSKKRKLQERETQLEYHAKSTKKVLKKLSTSGPVEPVLQRASKSSRNEFMSRFVEFVQRYVNSYHTLTADIETAQTQASTSRKNKRTKLKNEILKLLMDNPFVSTSEDIGIGLQYAFAILNYDLQESHLPRSNLSSITLTPDYLDDGNLICPYLGVIFITLHTKEELEEDSASIVDLFSRFEIDTKKGPGTHRSSGYIRALERVFFGGISSQNICMAHIVRVPNMSYPYRPFIAKKYGMTKGQYEKFKMDLEKFGALDRETGNERNPQAFFRTQQTIIQTVIALKHQKIINELQDWAKKHDISVGCLDKDGQFSENFDFSERLDDAIAQNDLMREMRIK